MPSERYEQLGRASAESQVHINTAQASCKSTREHIAQSRTAIERSLGLLRRRFNQLEH